MGIQSLDRLILEYGYTRGLKKGYSIGWIGSKETDFVITELGKPIEAIQVAYCDLETQKTKEREISALLECLDTLNLKQGTILTLTLEDHLTTNGRQIKFVPLYHWLCNS